MKKILECVKSNKAVTSIEYAIISSLIAAAIVIGLRNIGEGVSGTFNQISTALNSESEKGKKPHDDNGHGNDDDGTDESNPGKGKGGPNAYK